MSRVVLVLDTLSRGGTERQMALLARHWPADAPPLGAVVLSTPREDEISLPASVEVRRISRRRKYDPWLVPRIMKAARELDAAVLLAPHRFSGLLSKIVGRFLAVPVIVELRGRAHDTWKRRVLYDVIDEWLLPLAQAVVFNSGTVAAPFRSRSDLDGRISVILNAVEEPTGGRVHEPRQSDGRLQLLCVGRLVPIKRVHRSIDVLASLCDQGIDAALDIVGDGPERTRLEARAERLGLGDRVRFLGPLEDLHGVYGKADALIHPSAWENTSNVLLEAMAHGLVCVAYDVGGNGEVLDGGAAGVLVAEDNPTALADATLEALQDDKRCRDLSDAARARVHDCYSVEKCVREHRALVDELLAFRQP